MLFALQKPVKTMLTLLIRLETAAWLLIRWVGAYTTNTS